MDRIVVATDFLPRSVLAAHRAVHVARTLEAHLAVVHVLPGSGRLARWLGPSEDETVRFEHASVQLDALVQSVRAEGHAAVEGRLLQGRRIDALIAVSEAADLLVVGASRRRRWFDPLPGWLERLVRRVRVPVLVVRHHATPYQRVLAAVDLETPHANALAIVRAIAPAARIDVVHACHTPFEGTMQYAGVPASAIAVHRADALRSAVYRLTDAFVGNRPLPLTAHVVHGRPASEVLDKERELGADLAVVSRSKRNTLQDWVAPGVTSRLLDEGSADLLVVPA